MVNVIKRDGHVEPFDKEKLTGSVKKAMIDAKLSVEELKDEIDAISTSIMDKLTLEKEIDVSKIREITLNELENKKEAAAAAWRKFDGKYKSR